MDKEGVHKERMRRCRLVESVSLSISSFSLNCLAVGLPGSSGLCDPNRTYAGLIKSLFMNFSLTILMSFATDIGAFKLNQYQKVQPELNFQ